MSFCAKKAHASAFCAIEAYLQERPMPRHNEEQIMALLLHSESNKTFGTLFLASRMYLVDGVESFLLHHLCRSQASLSIIEFVYSASHTLCVRYKCVGGNNLLHIGVQHAVSAQVMVFLTTHQAKLLQRTNDHGAYPMDVMDFSNVELAHVLCRVNPEFIPYEAATRFSLLQRALQSRETNTNPSIDDVVAIMVKAAPQSLDRRMTSAEHHPFNLLLTSPRPSQSLLETFVQHYPISRLLDSFDPDASGMSAFVMVLLDNRISLDWKRITVRLVLNHQTNGHINLTLVNGHELDIDVMDMVIAEVDLHERVHSLSLAGCFCSPESLQALLNALSSVKTLQKFAVQFVDDQDGLDSFFSSLLQADSSSICDFTVKNPLKSSAIAGLGQNTNIRTLYFDIGDIDDDVQGLAQELADNIFLQHLTIRFVTPSIPAVYLALAKALARNQHLASLRYAGRACKQDTREKFMNMIVANTSLVHVILPIRDWRLAYYASLNQAGRGKAWNLATTKEEFVELLGPTVDRTDVIYALIRGTPSLWTQANGL
jgi:hypothetical protein